MTRSTRAATRLLARVVPAALVGLAVLLGSGPAGAVDGDTGGASIAHVETTADGLQVLVDVPEGADLDLGSTTVTIDGTEATATATPATASTALRRTTILVIDTSNSMRGARFTAARAAAKRFLRTVPDDVYVGVVGFATDVSTLLAPTQDHASAVSVIDDLQLSKGTSLYPGVIAAAAAAGTEGQRTLLVISDGADTSTTPLADAVAAITQDDINVDVVALDQGGVTVPGLDELATAGKGEVISADPSALRQAFGDEATTLANQVLVTVEVPASVTEAGTTEGTVEVTLAAAAGPISAQAFSKLATAPTTTDPAVPAPAAAGGFELPSWAKYAGPITVGVGILGVLFLLVPAKPAPLTAEERVNQYAAAPKRGQGGPKVEADQALNQARDVASELLQRNKGLEAKISKRLEGAGSELRAAEWLLVHGGVFVVSGLLGLLISKGNLIIGLVFLAVGFFGPWLYLGLRKSRRRRAFEGGLPDSLQLMSGSLSAGLSLAQSIDTIVREGPDPIAGEFKRVLVETRLGVSIEDALDGVSERFESKDFEWVVMAIRIQRQVGGNLAELLDTVAATMREREYMRRQVAALAAEGKLSAYVLGGLPPMFLLYLLLANRTYVMPLFTEPMGWAMLAGGSMILGVGVFWMSRLIKVEV